MAVPKKRLSKTKSKIRRTLWKKKAEKQANKAVSLAKSILNNFSKTENKLN